MRRLLLLLAVVFLLGLAGCLGDGVGDDSTDDIADDADVADDTDDSDATDDAPTDDDTEVDDAPDRDTDDDPPPEPTGELEIHHIDVGQADSTLIITPDGETILIDTGDWPQDGQDVIAYLESHDIDRIDHLIATHAHADHIGGHAAVIEWAETEGEGIGAAYDSGVPHTTQTFNNYLDAIEAHDVDLFTVEEGDELPLETGELQGLFINPPEGESNDDFHYNSVSTVFEFGEFSYVTTGDAEQDAESRMIDDWVDELEADAYQAGHHGSTTSSTQSFMDVVDPQFAIISSAFDSQYGHPHDEILEKYAEMGIETYWTGVHGDVVLETDGENIDISTAEEYSNDPADLLAAKPTEEDDTEASEEDDAVDDADDGVEKKNAIQVAELNVEGVSPDEEYIVLENTGDEQLDLGNWEIRDRDDGGQVAGGMSPFVFPADFELGAGDTVTIWTGDGENTDSDLYWGYGVNMWSADGDVIILKNADGDRVLEHPYGDQA